MLRGIPKCLLWEQVFRSDEGETRPIWDHSECVYFCHNLCFSVTDFAYSPALLESICSPGTGSVFSWIRALGTLKSGSSMHDKMDVEIMLSVKHNRNFGKKVSTCLMCHLQRNVFTSVFFFFLMWTIFRVYIKFVTAIWLLFYVLLCFLAIKDVES